MPGPITPHVKMELLSDGIHLSVKGSGICLPADMAQQIGNNLVALAKAFDPLGVAPLPMVDPSGQPIT